MSMKTAERLGVLLLILLFPSLVTAGKPEADKTLLRLNQQYQQDALRLRELNPDSREAELIRERMGNSREQIERIIEKAVEEHGVAWREAYRDKAGRLPGGFIEDDRSRLAAAEQRGAKINDELSRLEQRFKELGKEKQAIDQLPDYQSKGLEEFRKKYFAEHGIPKDETDPVKRRMKQKAFENACNHEIERLTERWKEKKKAISQSNREKGRLIREIAQKRAEAEQLKEKVAALKPRAQLERQRLAEEQAKAREKEEAQKRIEKASPGPRPEAETVLPREEKKPPQDNKFVLRVVTFTHNSEEADMDENLHVYLCLNGEGQKLELDTPKDDFEPGAMDVFDLDFDYPLAKIKYILLTATGDDEWLCDHMSFQFFQDSKKSRVYRFDGPGWISGDAGDMQRLGAVAMKRFPINPPVNLVYDSGGPRAEKPELSGKEKTLKCNQQYREFVKKERPVIERIGVELAAMKKNQKIMLDALNGLTGGGYITWTTRKKRITGKALEIINKIRDPICYMAWGSREGIDAEAEAEIEADSEYFMGKRIVRGSIEVEEHDTGPYLKTVDDAYHVIFQAEMAIENHIQKLWDINLEFSLDTDYCGMRGDAKAPLQECDDGLYGLQQVLENHLVDAMEFISRAELMAQTMQEAYKRQEESDYISPKWLEDRIKRVQACCGLYKSMIRRLGKAQSLLENYRDSYSPGLRERCRYCYE